MNEQYESNLRTLAEKINDDQLSVQYFTKKVLDSKKDIEYYLKKMGILEDGYILNAQGFFDFTGNKWMFNMGSLTVYGLLEYISKDGKHDFPTLPLLSTYNKSFLHAGDLVMVRARYLGDNVLIFLDKRNEQPLIIEKEKPNDKTE